MIYGLNGGHPVEFLDVFFFISGHSILSIQFHLIFKSSRGSQNGFSLSLPGNDREE